MFPLLCGPRNLQAVRTCPVCRTPCFFITPSGGELFCGVLGSLGSIWQHLQTERAPPDFSFAEESPNGAHWALLGHRYSALLHGIVVSSALHCLELKSHVRNELWPWHTARWRGMWMRALPSFGALQDMDWANGDVGGACGHVA